MRLEHYPVEKLKKEILGFVGKHIDLRTHKVFFFGSRVSGGGSERSDIDVGIEGPQEIPIEILGRIREEIENLPTLYKIEVVDFKSTSDEFREVALQHTEVLN
ncbi:MAG: nucleotidyltransferase domain-containing protein [Ignavibacteriales bacterium]|nr:nucleotidyltransferase domain-containing protein [Ignavibacteriales bacterium]